jgi:hypothetical protein
MLELSISKTKQRAWEISGGWDDEHELFFCKLSSKRVVSPLFKEKSLPALARSWHQLATTQEKESPYVNPIEALTYLKSWAY